MTGDLWGGSEDWEHMQTPRCGWFRRNLWKIILLAAALPVSPVVFTIVAAVLAWLTQ